MRRLPDRAAPRRPGKLGPRHSAPEDDLPGLARKFAPELGTRSLYPNAGARSAPARRLRVVRSGRDPGAGGDARLSKEQRPFDARRVIAPLLGSSVARPVRSADSVPPGIAANRRRPLRLERLRAEQPILVGLTGLRRCLAMPDARDYAHLWAWEPVHPQELAEFLASFARPWWICGGWALDLFLDRETRRHDDLDVALLRKDQVALFDYLRAWDLHYATPAHALEPWDGRPPRPADSRHLGASLHRGGCPVDVRVSAQRGAQWPVALPPE
jgi:hypothetical protein